VLAAQLAELREAEKLDEVLALLRPAVPAVPAAAAAVGRVAELEALLRLRDEEFARLRGTVDRAREAGARAREREAMQKRAREQVEAELARLRASAAAAMRPAAAPAAEHSAQTQDLERRLRRCEDERERAAEVDEQLRRQLALEHSRVRDLEAELAELEELIPANRRRKKKPLPPLPEAERRVLVPHLSPSFYKSLEGKDRKAVERAVQAILLFCTEGHSYPGLEVKQLRGQDTWSLRASLGLRVYFRHLPDGDIEVLELADREDQHTALRRLKER